MSRCKHTEWLRLRRDNGQAILETSDRSSRVLDDVRNPEEPAGLVMLIGNQTKLRLLSTMCPGLPVPKSARHHGETHLHVSSARATKPLVLAEGDVPVHGRWPTSSTAHRCHETTRHRLSEDASYTPKAAQAADVIYQQVVFPLADVVCLFVADLGGTDPVVQRLAAWAASARGSTSPVRPGLLLVVPRGEKKEMQVAINRMTQPGDPASLRDHFQYINIAALSPTRKPAWERKQLMALRRRLYQAVELAQRERCRASLLFSIHHTVALGQMAAEGASAQPLSTMDLIEMSRRSRPVASDLALHLADFLKDVDCSAAVEQSAVPVVASSLILDHYPPGMHHFHPDDVFRTLYHHVCIQATKKVNGLRVRAGRPPLPLTRMVGNAMVDGFRHLPQLGSAVALHRHRLSLASRHWSPPPSEKTCAVCIRRPPQYCLPCRHWICQTCVRTFGRLDTADPWLFHVEGCLWCGDTIDFCVRVKPDTATARVLSIDGGGTRGRAPLEFLRALQHAVELPYPVQRNFDVVYGTSSGAMIACALCINGWPVDECIERFESLSQIAFEKRPSARALASVLGGVPCVVPIVQFVASLVVDCKYPADNLEAALRDTYGGDRSIVDSDGAARAGALVGVTLTSTDNTSTFVVTNYNGAGSSRDHPGFAAAPQRLSRSNPARVVSRHALLTQAPSSYFTAHHIQDAGTFQDGGLTFNNPVSIAVKEAAALFPLMPNPSIVVSLGTGSKDHCEPRSPSFGSAWRESFGAAWDESFPMRLARAFEKHSDPDAVWKDLLGRQAAERQAAYTRFDIRLDEAPAALDDVDSMDLVAQIARDTALNSPQLPPLAKCIRAEHFVFELDATARPRLLRGGAYRCVGHIYCRLRAGTVEFATFMRQLAQRSAVFQCQGRPLPSGSAFLLPAAGTGDDGDADFGQTVVFQVPSRHAPYRITLQEGPSSVCDISGSPFTLDGLIKQQKLDASFGRDDHRQCRKE